MLGETARALWALFFIDQHYEIAKVLPSRMPFAILRQSGVKAFLENPLRK